MQNHEGSKESKDVQNEFGYATKNLNKNSREEYLMRNTYSKLSIIKPDPSRLLEFEKKEHWLLNRDIFQISRPGCSMEPKNWPQQR